MNDVLTYKTTPFMSGRSQAIRIPKAFRLEDKEEVVVNRVGNSIIITPVKDLTASFYAGAERLTDDFMADGRPEEVENERPAL